jgi:hypothetical protein
MGETEKLSFLAAVTRDTGIIICAISNTLVGNYSYDETLDEIHGYIETGIQLHLQFNLLSFLFPPNSISQAQAVQLSLLSTQFFIFGSIP